MELITLCKMKEHLQELIRKTAVDDMKDVCLPGILKCLDVVEGLIASAEKELDLQYDMMIEQALTQGVDCEAH